MEPRSGEARPARPRLDPAALWVDVELWRPGLRIVVHLVAGPGVTVLLGPSGSGKSTTLDAISGHVRPQKGRIALFGAPVFDDGRGDGGRALDLAPRKRRIGYVQQSQALFPHLSVRENLRYGLFRLRRDQAEQRLLQMAEELDLVGLLSRAPASLSGGERQRVALGRTLLTEPRALLLDEPLSAVDAASRRGLFQLLQGLPGRLGIPVVHVTHNEEEAAQYGQQILHYRECAPDGDRRVVEVVPAKDAPFV